MAKEVKKEECKCDENCCDHHQRGGLYAGFRFGFGFWSAGLLVTTIVSLISILIWYVSTII